MPALLTADTVLSFSPGRARNTWLACDLCGQWRRLGKMKDACLPEQWTCDQNPYARQGSNLTLDSRSSAVL